MLFFEGIRRTARRFKSRGGAVCIAIVASVTVSPTGAFEKSDGLPQGGAILIDREVLVPGLRGRPNAMARLVTGGFVIVGAWGTAWAAGTDANGRLLWIYEEPRDPLVQSQDQSEFSGAVPLASGGVLLCGQTSNKDHQAGIGLIVIMNGAGKIVERRSVYPNDNESIRSSSFKRCVRWGEGLALMGRGNDGGKGFFWLVRLDESGKKVWEKIGPEIPGFNGVAAADHSFALMGSLVGTGVTIVRLSDKGEVMARTSTSFPDGRPVRSIDASIVDELVAVDTDNENILVTLRLDLKEAERAKRIGPPSIRDGCAYRLPDGSIVLFGSKAGSVYRSAIGWVNRPWKEDVVREMSVPAKPDGSVSVRDAVSLSANRFVAMRDQVSSTNPANTGVVLSWVSFR